MKRCYICFCAFVAVAIMGDKSCISAAANSSAFEKTSTPAAGNGKYSTSAPAPAPNKKPAPPGKQQAPTWSQNDLSFFLHGSMGTEVFPERMLRAFIKTYPDLFPSKDLTHQGLIADPEFGWP